MVKITDVLAGSSADRAGIRAGDVLASINGNDIVDGIVILAVNEIPHVELYTPTSPQKMKNKSVKVFVDKEGVFVEVIVKVHFTQSISEVAFKIQESVRHNVEAMTEYKISAVNVVVNGVSFEDITEDKSVAINTENQQEG